MNKVFKIIINIVILSCFIACKKKDAEAQLPEATHSGANIAGFLVNGSPQSTSGKSDNVFSWGTKYYNIYDTTLQISATGKNSPRFDLTIRIPWNRIIGTYPLTSKYPCRTIYMNFPDGNTPLTGNNQYKNDDQHTGQVTITYWDGDIVAGTFSMTLVNDSGEVVHITDGRFDIINN